MVDSTESPPVEWLLGVPDGFAGRSAGSYHRLGKAREAGASAAGARGVQMPLDAREIVESTIYAVRGAVRSSGGSKMLAHAEVVKPPAPTVHAMQAANARAKRLGRSPVYARVRRKTTSGSYVYRWVRLPAATPRTSVGGAVSTPAVTTPVVPPVSVPPLVGGLESGIPVR